MGGRRRCLDCTNDIENDKENWFRFWNIVKVHAYTADGSTEIEGPGGHDWILKEECDDGNAHGKIWKRKDKNEYMMGFAGSDDGMDWVDNIVGAFNFGVG